MDEKEEMQKMLEVLKELEVMEYEKGINTIVFSDYRPKQRGFVSPSIECRRLARGIYRHSERGVQPRGV